MTPATGGCCPCVGNDDLMFRRLRGAASELEATRAENERLENALRVAWSLVRRHGDEHEIVTVKDALASFDAARAAVVSHPPSQKEKIMADEHTFVMTREHLDLLAHAVVSWDDCEFGAPSIDCKRPYGNSSVYQDMAEILGIDYDEDEAIPSAVVDRLDTLHRETLTALQVMLRGNSTRPGVYKRLKSYGTDWRFVGADVPASHPPSENEETND